MARLTVRSDIPHLGDALRAICNDGEHAQAVLLAWLTNGAGPLAESRDGRLTIGNGWRVSVEDISDRHWEGREYGVHQ